MISSDIVIKNAKIHTMVSDDIYKNIVIKNKKIIHIGNDEKEILNYISENTKVIDAKDKIILPGFIDSHTHPPGTAMTKLYEVSLYGLHTIKEYQDKICEFMKENKDIKVIIGRGWSLSAFEKEEITKGPKKEHLDEITKDIPIILRAYDGHTTWLNSKAFEVNNIDVNTIPPQGGKIEINEETNTVWGTLKETATHLADDSSYSDEQFIKAFEEFQKDMHKLGITSMLSISGFTWGIQPKHYEALYKDNLLKLRVSNSIMIFPYDDYCGQIDEIIKIREKYDNEYFKTVNVKILGDGVVEASTAYLLDPYETCCGKGEKYYGDFTWEDDTLRKVIEKSNENKLSLQVHSVGDGATNKMLDAFDDVIEKNESYKNARNVLTHLQLVDKKDIPRFRELGIIASIQPYWHVKAPGWWEEVDAHLLGRLRAENEYPLNSFVKEKVMIASSSDHSVTTIPNPIWGIHAGVNRNLYNEKSFGIEDIKDIDDKRYLLNKQERVSLEEMLKSFTINNAYMIFREDEVGSIEVGKFADLVMLDTDIYEVEKIDIQRCKVAMTIFDGEIVYEI